MHGVLYSLVFLFQRNATRTKHGCLLLAVSVSMRNVFAMTRRPAGGASVPYYCTDMGLPNQFSNQQGWMLMDVFVLWGRFVLLLVTSFNGSGYLCYGQ